MEKQAKAAVQYNNEKMWQIGFFSLNNCATNIAMFLMMQYSYYTQNVLGLAAAIIGIIVTATRIFDAVTDPLVGFLVDRTNGRFGKFRPYIFLKGIGKLVNCAGEHKILPHHQPQFITDVIEIILRVIAASPHPYCVKISVRTPF